MASRNEHPNPNNDSGRPIDWDGEFAKLDTAGNVVPFQRKPTEPAGADVERYNTSYEIDLDDHQDDAPGSASSPLVGEVLPAKGAADPGFTVTVPTGADGREPIIPVAFRPENIRATVTLAVRRWLHIAGFHAVRTPIYAAKAVWWGVVGGFKLAKRQIGWWWLTEQHGLRQQVASSGDKDAANTWYKLHREVKVTRRWRGILLAGQALGVTFGGMALWNMAPTWITIAAGAMVLGALAHFGQPVDKPILSRAVIAARFRKLNLDIVLRAYYAAGLGHPDRPNMQVQFAAPMARDARNTGSRVMVDLPFGKGWSDVLAAKEKIASGLDVHVNQVFLTPDKSSQRRHVLFVADRDPLAVPVGRTDLLDRKPRNIWQPVRFGKDERDQLVTLSLLWASVLVGAQPRKGKTFAARLLALHAALDPFVKLCIVDGKNSPDWIKFKLVAHRIIFGTHANPNDDDPIGNLLAALDEILAHISRVNEVLAKLPVDVCPEGKLTEELARDPRFPDLRVLMLVMEEFQVYFETEDQAVNKDIATKLSRIQAVGPSAGVIILSSSQKPSGVGAGDVGRLFNRYRDNHAARFALKCGNRLVSEAVLGGDAYAEGFDAAALPVGDEYRGVGYLYGVTDNTPTVRTFLADHGDAEKILTAARAHRERIGTLTGMAAGEDMTRASRDVLADVLAVFVGDDRLHWTTIATRLAEQMPEQYADITADSISAQLRSLGVPSGNVNRDGAVKKGAKAADIQAATTKRNINGA